MVLYLGRGVGEFQLGIGLLLVDPRCLGWVVGHFGIWAPAGNTFDDSVAGNTTRFNCVW